MKLFAAILSAALLASAAFAADVDIYSAREIQTMSQALAAKHTSFASRDLARYGNHYLMLAYREETGSSELHETEADIFVVESGSATILTGGKLISGHTVKSGEIRGSGIQGGERHFLGAGDIVHIPAGTPHQLLLDKSKPFTYFVVKVSGQ
ncbi:MAG: cupin domain-containing protein [Acidobacteriaceae bacterium]|nr:cupin domain-containing protein [Acidobacteriaceae bacterium]